MRAIAYIERLPGIRETTGDLESVTVTYDSSEVSPDEIAAAIDEAGYHVDSYSIQEYDRRGR